MPNKLTVVAPLQKKGGCGKSATLGSVAIYLDKFLEIPAHVLDLDSQNTLYEEFDGDVRRWRHFVEFDGFNQDTVIRKFRRNGFRSNRHLTAHHYHRRISQAYLPTELAEHDEKAQAAIRAVVERELKKGDMVLFCDTPPTRLVDSTVMPFVCLDGLVDQYHFLTVSRPVAKEMRSADIVYEFVRTRMVEHGVDESRINRINVLNHAPLVNVLADQQRQAWEQCLEETREAAIEVVKQDDPKKYRQAHRLVEDHHRKLPWGDILQIIRERECEELFNELVQELLSEEFERMDGEYKTEATDHHSDVRKVNNLLGALGIPIRYSTEEQERRARLNDHLSNGFTYMKGEDRAKLMDFSSPEERERYIEAERLLESMDDYRRKGIRSELEVEKWARDGDEQVEFYKETLNFEEDGERRKREDYEFKINWDVEIPEGTITLPTVVRGSLGSNQTYCPIKHSRYIFGKKDIDQLPDEFAILRGTELDGSLESFEKRLEFYSNFLSHQRGDTLRDSLGLPTQTEPLFDPFGKQRQVTSEAHYIHGIREIAERILRG